MIEGQDGVTWPQWLALAQACESHGIPALFRSDHHLNLGGQSERGSLDAWATIAALAAHTSTLRLGTLVSPATFRHPSELAKVVVAADHVSGGRVELGLGAGWHEREHAAYGFPFPPLKVRMDMLAEQLEIVHGHWADEPFSFAGEHYRLEALEAQPKPVQRPHPPLLMGGIAGPRGAALAARWADEYNTPFAMLGDVAAMKDRVTAACEAAGREPIPFSLMTGVIVGRDRGEVRERARLRGRAAPGRRGSRRVPLIDHVVVDHRHRRRGRRAARRAARRGRRPGHVPAPAARRPRRGRPDRRRAGADAGLAVRLPHDT